MGLAVTFYFWQIVPWPENTREGSAPRKAKQSGSSKGKSKKFMQDHLQMVKDVKARIKKMTLKNKRKKGGTRKYLGGGHKSYDDMMGYDYKIKAQ